MSDKKNIVKLKQLQAEADRIRRQLGINTTNAVLFLASADDCGDEQVVVEADGFGGATVSVIEGNYPIEFLTRREKWFDSEEAAVVAAEKIIQENAEPETVLG